MSNLQLNGQVDTRDQQIAELEAENSELSARVRDLEMELARTKRENQRAIAGVRGILAPLHGVLKQLFGEMDAIGVEEIPSVTNKGAKWEVVKKRLTPRLCEAIDILLVQGSMKRTQLASAMKMDYSNCTKNVVTVLVRQGLMIDNGRELSLKEL